MKGKLLNSDRITQVIFDNLPIEAFSDWRVRPNESSEEDNIPPEKLWYLMFRRRDEIGRERFELWPYNHPEIGGVGFYQLDSDSRLANVANLSGSYMDEKRTLNLGRLIVDLFNRNLTLREMQQV